MMQVEPYIPAQHYSLPFRQFNELVRSELGRADYEVVSANHWQNDSGHIFAVGLHLYDTYMQGRVQAFIAGEIEQVYVIWLLYELAARGVIPEGHYRIEVSW